MAPGSLKLVKQNTIISLMAYHCSIVLQSSKVNICKCVYNIIYHLSMRACMRACVRHGRSTEAIWPQVKNWYQGRRSELEATWRMSLVVPAIALTTGKTTSLLDVWAQLDMELYTYLCWLVVSAQSRSMNGDSCMVMAHRGVTIACPASLAWRHWEWEGSNTNEFLNELINWPCTQTGCCKCALVHW